eukprot:5834768-Pleurochrysis_carterae.AAC.3
MAAADDAMTGPPAPCRCALSVAASRAAVSSRSASAPAALLIGAVRALLARPVWDVGVAAGSGVAVVVTRELEVALHCERDVQKAGVRLERALRGGGKRVRVARRLWVPCDQHGPSGSAKRLEAGDDVRPAALGELAPHLKRGAVPAVDAPSVLDLREG